MASSGGNVKSRGVVVFGSPVSVGHVRPLMPLARRLVERGFKVVWAISGDDNEPASVWRQPLAELGVHFVNVDDVQPFPRGATAEVMDGGPLKALFRRIAGRANDVAAATPPAASRATAPTVPGTGGNPRCSSSRRSRPR